MSEAAEAQVTLLLGHLKAKVRNQFAAELRARGFSVSEAPLPAVLRQMALTQRAQVVLCPPGWLGEDDRRELRIQRISMVEVDAEASNVADVIALIHTAARQASEQSVKGSTPSPSFQRPGPGGDSPLRASTPPLAFQRPRGELSGASPVFRANTPPTGPRSPSRPSTPSPQELKESSSRKIEPPSQRRTGPKARVEKGKKSPQVAKASLAKVAVAIVLGVLAVALVAYQLSNI